jgi:hypothetical protein
LKIPKWQFEKFPGADENLGPQMKSVGEVMAIGRTFKEALLKGVRALDTGKKDGVGENRAEDSHPAPGDAASRTAFLRSLRPAPGPHRQTTGEDDIYRSLVPVPAQRD